MVFINGIYYNIDKIIMKAVLFGLSPHSVCIANPSPKADSRQGTQSEGGQSHGIGDDKNIYFVDYSPKTDFSLAFLQMLVMTIV